MRIVLLHFIKHSIKPVFIYRSLWLAAVHHFAIAAESIGWHRLSYLLFLLLERRATALSTSNRISAFKIKQFVEFHRAKNEWLGNTNRVGSPDPLFRCQVKEQNFLTRPPNRFAGRYSLEFTHLGLRLDGFLSNEAVGSQNVALWLDNQYIRSLPLYYRKWAPPFFHYHIKREVIARFPQSSQLSISTMEGKHLRFRKSSAAKVEVPHGDSTIFDYLSSASGIDKKGFLSLAPDTIEARQQRYLKIYARAQKYFSQSFGSPLFLMYGTLLGHIREGDFIQSDDDFDAGYLSHKRTAADVKRETMHLVVDLVLAGFTCSFNRNGRLFRLRLKDDKPDVHLDVRPVWYENGYIWAHKQACLPLEISDFEPVRTEILRGVEVDVPKNAERVLAAYYGEGWKVPDPSYSNASQKVPRFVTRKLKSVCITPADYQEMQAQIDARRPDYPEAGKLIATGLYPLYPLEDYEANCEW